MIYQRSDALVVHLGSYISLPVGATIAFLLCLCLSLWMARNVYTAARQTLRSPRSGEGGTVAALLGQGYLFLNGSVILYCLDAQLPWSAMPEPLMTVINWLTIMLFVLGVTALLALHILGRLRNGVVSRG